MPSLDVQHITKTGNTAKVIWSMMESKPERRKKATSKTVA